MCILGSQYFTGQHFSPGKQKCFAAKTPIGDNISIQTAKPMLLHFNQGGNY